MLWDNRPVSGVKEVILEERKLGRSLLQEPKGQKTNVGKGGWTREMDVEDMDDAESTEHGTYLDMGPRRGQLKIILLKCCYHKSNNL